MGLTTIGLGVAVVSLLIWIGLLMLWGRFWLCDQRLAPVNETGAAARLEGYPPVCAVIPARNEAEMLPQTLRSLLGQTYTGPFHIILVDDHSTDGTGEIARQIAIELNQAKQLTVLSAEPLPPGWTGKLWAMEQGIRHAQTLASAPSYFLFTDADIQHAPDNLHQLVSKAQADNRELVSLMVLLRCQSFWEKLLLPAFVFFFQLLYPFPLVNTPSSRVAAAAGGCILIRRETLERIGGISILKQALIDDCTLAQAVKLGSRSAPDAISAHTDPLKPSRRIWLGLTQTTYSLRPYDSLQTIWDMVARTAYTQLNYSPLLLVGTVLGMTLVYLVAPIATVVGLLIGHWAIALVGLAAWLLMALAYWPTIRLYSLNPLWSFCLPVIAFLYTLMTLDSARRHWQGRGGAWKGRIYPS